MKWLVGAAAVFIGALWLALSIERMGWRTVIGLLAIAIFIRHRRSTD